MEPDQLALAVEENCCFAKERIPVTVDSDETTVAAFLGVHHDDGSMIRARY